MPKVNATPTQDAFSIINIQDSYVNKRFRILKNVRLIRVWRDAPNGTNSQAFPGSDYEPWWECPAKHDSCFSIICPPETRPHWEEKRSPHSGFTKGTFPIEIEDFVCDLKLTDVEADRFLEDAQGKIEVMKEIGSKLLWFDPIRKKNVTLRHGRRDVVMPASGDIASEDLSMADEYIGEGLYREFTWREITDIDYLVRASNPVGLDSPNERMAVYAAEELKRRGYVQKGNRWELPEESPAEEPVEETGKTPVTEPVAVNQCSAATRNGERCKNAGTIEVDGKAYCNIHAPVTAENPSGIKYYGEHGGGK